MATIQPITLYGHIGGPNPWKVAIIMHELNIPKDHKIVDMNKLKEEPYTDLNPNGRVPAIEDPNTGITLWESGAIVEYLVATYDKDHKLSYPANSKEDWLCKQWLYFQTSGQGPYFGQGVWFTNFHQDATARKRYKDESERVTKVLDTHLARTGTGYLVGNKLTYADLSFVPWIKCLAYMWRLENEPQELNQMFDKYPHYKKWVDSMLARQSYKDVWEGERGELNKKK